MPEASQLDPPQISEHVICKVFLTGVSVDSANRGCRALASSLINLIASRTNVASISFISRFPPTVLPYHLGEDVVSRLQPLAYVSDPASGKIRLILTAVWHLLCAILFRVIPVGFVRRQILRRNLLIKSIAEADFFGDVREGDSFTDLYGIIRLVMGSVPALLRIVMGKRLVLLPQTYGPFKTVVARTLASFIMRHSTVICSRDKQGLDVASRLLGKHRRSVRLVYCPDVAFTLPSTLPSPLEVDPDLGPAFDKTLVGVNLSGLVMHGDYGRNLSFGLTLDCRKFIYGLISQLLASDTVHIVLIPHVFYSGIDDDTSVCRALWEEMRTLYGSRIHLVSAEYSEIEVKGIIGLCDFFVGSRMHACIAALSQAVPAVGIAYSGKFNGVFESIGAEECVVDARQTDVETAVARCMDLFQRRLEMKAVLSDRAAEVQEQVFAAFDEIMRND